MPLDDFARVTFVFLDARVVCEAHVVMHIEVEERARLATSLGSNQVIEGVLMWDDEVLQRRWG